jgi:hypothetical protein
VDSLQWTRKSRGKLPARVAKQLMKRELLMSLLPKKPEKQVKRVAKPVMAEAVVEEVVAEAEVVINKLTLPDQMTITGLIIRPVFYGCASITLQIV